MGEWYTISITKEEKMLELYKIYTKYDWPADFVQIYYTKINSILLSVKVGLL